MPYTPGVKETYSLAISVTAGSGVLALLLNEVGDSTTDDVNWGRILAMVPKYFRVWLDAYR